VDEVRGLAGNALFQRDVEDTGAACFRFRNGTMGLLAVSVAIGEPRDSLDVYGSSGSIHVPVLNLGTVRVRRGGEKSCENHPPHANLHQPLVEDFARAVLHGRQPEVGGETGLEVQRLIEAVYGARAEG
jgi:predicted dehydrogenase